MAASTTLSTLFQLDRIRARGGVVGLVDDLLTYCAERRARLTWSSGVVTANPGDGGAVESVQPDIRNSAYRACLARLSAICHEQEPEAGSPYGGTGEFVVGRLPGVRFRLVFTNTPDEQRLELEPEVVSEVEAGVARKETNHTIRNEPGTVQTERGGY